MTNAGVGIRNLTHPDRTPSPHLPLLACFDMLSVNNHAWKRLFTMLWIARVLTCSWAIHTPCRVLSASPLATNQMFLGQSTHALVFIFLHAFLVDIDFGIEYGYDNRQNQVYTCLVMDIDIIIEFNTTVIIGRINRYCGSSIMVDIDIRI